MARFGIVSVQEAAERLGVHRSRVEGLILSGALPARKTGSQWLLERRELDLFDNVRPYRRGRPLSASVAWSRIGRPDEMLRRREPGSLGWSKRLRARPEREQPNVWLHVVPDDAWDDVPQRRHLGLFVAWLDLADRLDRGADLVLDRLGGRARA